MKYTKKNQLAIKSYVFIKIFKDDHKFFYIPAYFAFTACLVDIAFVYFFIPETLPVEKRAKSFISSVSGRSENLF